LRVISPSKVLNAAGELRSKSFSQIASETAETWGARALAAYDMYRSTGNRKWLVEAVSYHHEAVEHAADAGPAMLTAISAELDQMQRTILR
jgi:hypothetical protein